ELVPVPEHFRQVIPSSQKLPGVNSILRNFLPLREASFFLSLALTLMIQFHFPVELHLSMHANRHVAACAEKLHNLFPSRASCAQRDAVSGFCSRPRSSRPSKRKSTSRNLDRLVLRTGKSPPSTRTVLDASTMVWRQRFLKCLR